VTIMLETLAKSLSEKVPGMLVVVLIAWLMTTQHSQIVESMEKRHAAGIEILAKNHHEGTDYLATQVLILSRQLNNMTFMVSAANCLGARNEEECKKRIIDSLTSISAYQDQQMKKLETR